MLGRIKQYLNISKINLTPTIHKILDHGCDFLDFFEDQAGSGTGVFSEEPGEAMIRKIRNIRANHARTTSREDNNYDSFVNSYIFNRFFMPKYILNHYFLYNLNF